MTLQVHTARISYGGPDRLDVTRKGAWLARKAGRDAPGEPWAPSWDLLKKAKGGELHFDEYDPLFLAEMRVSYQRHRTAWDGLLARSRVVLVCYCVDAEQCHRWLLRTRIFPALGAVDAGEVGA
jgi:hypothetical protein